MSCGPWIQPCCPEVAGCDDCHPHLTLTKNQDVVNRATLDVEHQVLNLPPDIVARRQGLGLSQFIPPGMFTPIGGMGTVAVDTTGGVMAPVGVADTLVIPRTGCYDLWGSAATWDLEVTEYIQVRLQINGMGTLGGGETTRGLGVGSFFVSPVVHTFAHWFSAGDVVRLLVLTDKPTGILIDSAYLGGHYLEGT